VNRQRPRFARVAAKRLQAVEVDTRASNQHEFNGVQAFKDLLGTERLNERPARFIRFGDDELLEDTTVVTWYDAREAHETRSEWRLYYRFNSVIEAAREGDLLVVLEPLDGEFEFFVAAAGSTEESQLRWLLDIGDVDQTVRLFEPGELQSRLTEAGLLEMRVALSLEPTDDQDVDLQQLLTTFPDGLPTTAIFSAFARGQVAPQIVESPDEAIESWMAMEERLFRAYERQELGARLEQGFWDAETQSADVDGFASFALSIMNRRKARAGQALEHHLQAILDFQGVAYERGATTEGAKKPDFLFPGSAVYEAARADHGLRADLRMLGVKTSCKDRWRQVLSEADLIPNKHLLTLEAPISTSQTSEMNVAGLSLVIPQRRHLRFLPRQQESVLGLAEFLHSLPSKSRSASQ